MSGASVAQQQAASGPSRLRTDRAASAPQTGPSSSLLAALHSFDELSDASVLCLADIAPPPLLRACRRRGTPGQRAMPGGPTDEEMRAASREARAASARLRLRQREAREPPKIAWRAMESWTTGESSAASRTSSQQPATHVLASAVRESTAPKRLASAPPAVLLPESQGLPIESLLPAARLAAQQALQAEREREEAAHADEEAALVSLEREQQQQAVPASAASGNEAAALRDASASPRPVARGPQLVAERPSTTAAAATSAALLAAAAPSSTSARSAMTSSDATTSVLSHRAQVLMGNKRGARLGVGRPAAPPVVVAAAAPATSSPAPDSRAHLEPMPFDDDEDPFTSSVSSSDHAHPGSDPAPPPAADPVSEADEPPLYFHGSRRPDATNYTTQAASVPTRRAPTRAEKLAAAQEARQQQKARLAAEIKDAKAGQKQGAWRWTTTQDVQGDVTDPSLDMSTSRTDKSAPRAGERVPAPPGWKSRMLLPPSMLGEQIRHEPRQTASSPGAPAAVESETESEDDGVPPPPPSCSLPAPAAAADDSVTESEDDGPLLRPGVQPRLSPEKSKTRRRVLMRDTDEGQASKRRKTTQRRPAERTASAPNLFAPVASGSRSRRRNVVPGAP
jgi:hypothetical protein